MKLVAINDKLLLPICSTVRMMEIIQKFVTWLIFNLQKWFVPIWKALFKANLKPNNFKLKMTIVLTYRAERQLAYSQSHKVLLAKLLVGTNTRLVELEYYFLSLLIG